MVIFCRHSNEKGCYDNNRYSLEGFSVLLVGMANLNIASFNVRGITDCAKRRKMFDFLRERGFDLILPQETHSTVKVERQWRNEWGGNVYYSHVSNNS